MTYDLTINQGETYGQAFVWKENDTPVNLTGYSARMQIRRSVTSPAATLSLTTANGKITLGSAGQITLGIDAIATANLDAGNYVYDLEVVTGDTVRRLLSGGVKVTREVTR